MGNLSQMERTFGNHEWRLDRLDRDAKRLKQQGGGGNSPGGSSGSGFLAWAGTGGFSGRSGTTLGSGSYVALSADGGELVETGETDTAYSTDTEVISAGKLIWVQKDKFGTLLVSRLECEEA